MRKFITLLLMALIVIATNTFASHGKTATSATTKMEAKIGVATNDVLIFSKSKDPVRGLTPMQIIKMDRIIRGKVYITGDGRTSLKVSNAFEHSYRGKIKIKPLKHCSKDNLTPCEEQEQVERIHAYRIIYMDYITRKKFQITSNYNLNTSLVRTMHS